MPSFIPKLEVKVSSLLNSVSCACAFHYQFYILNVKHVSPTRLLDPGVVLFVLIFILKISTQKTCMHDELVKESIKHPTSIPSQR